MVGRLVGLVVCFRFGSVMKLMFITSWLVVCSFDANYKSLTRVAGN